MADWPDGQSRAKPFETSAWLEKLKKLEKPSLNQNISGSPSPMMNPNSPCSPSISSFLQRPWKIIIIKKEKNLQVTLPLHLSLLSLPLPFPLWSLSPIFISLYTLSIHDGKKMALSKPLHRSLNWRSVVVNQSTDGEGSIRLAKGNKTWQKSCPVVAYWQRCLGKNDEEGIDKREEARGGASGRGGGGESVNFFINFYKLVFIC